MLTDFWADYYFRNPKAKETVEDDDFDLDAELEKLNAEAESREAENNDDPDEWETVSPDVD